MTGRGRWSPETVCMTEEIMYTNGNDPVMQENLIQETRELLK